MPRTAEVQVRITDMDEFKRIVAELEERIAEAMQERDEWEERYEWLLAESGGTAPTSRGSR